MDFDDWVVAVFDPAAEDPWPTPAEDLAFLTRLFSDAVPALEPFTDDEIGKGLWSIIDSGGAGTALAVNDASLPLDDRIAAVRTIPTLYRDVFVPRCTERLGHLSEETGHLGITCYMFWDVAVIGGPPDTREGNLLEDAVLDVLHDLLRLPHGACQESALHGLGHRIRRHPEQGPAMLDRWLRDGDVRDERLRAYAQAARTGCIQ